MLVKKSFFSVCLIFITHLCLFVNNKTKSFVIVHQVIMDKNEPKQNLKWYNITPHFWNASENKRQP